MENDLSLSQSFGGLRIANPDDGSPGASSEVPLNSRVVSAALTPLRTTEHTAPQTEPAPITKEARSTTDPQSQSQSRRHSFFNILRRGESAADPPAPSRTPPQPHDSRLSNPRSDSSGSESYKHQNNDPSARAAATKAYRQSMPLSMPLNHQAQQQAQFPPYQTHAVQWWSIISTPGIVSACIGSVLSSTSPKYDAFPRTLIQTTK